MKNREEDSIFQVIKELRLNGIHSIVVNTSQEAKNFIMYHVGVGTIIFLDNSKEVKKLAIEKTAINKGATLYDINEIRNMEKDKGKSYLTEIIIYGFDKFLEILKEKKINQLPVSKIKIVIVIQMKSFKEGYVSLYNKNISMALLDFQEIIKINKRDISIIFIGEE